MNASQNALANETSPYLLQHADNPVSWHPWGGEALSKARKENKPILLSVGYSACHWCHVMAHESFEDNSTASLMNQLFVNIKVDREERPDIDKIYQLSHQLLTRRSGGWPLTMFLTPDDHTPFFGGTYFPLEPRYGMPSFKEVLTRVSEFYTNNRDDIRNQNRSLVSTMQSLEPRPGAPTVITDQPLKEARSELSRIFEDVHGGFGHAPKFPHPTNLERLLRSYAASAHSAQPDFEGLQMAEFTLRKMANGGLYDHLGGGFCRYSVDEYWMIPHFEKMLYDNGPLLTLYCELWQLSRNPVYRRVANETADWVIREMQATAGGYYSTIDADSEGIEGKYYLWTPEEVQGLLTNEEYTAVSHRFGLNRPANFENEWWHFHVFADDEALEGPTGFTSDHIDLLLSTARETLFNAREQRVRPGLDDKILTSWNGLMIKGMAKAGRVLGERRLIDSATRALDFVTETMWRDDRLLATSKDGRAHLNAYLDDYAFLIDGIVELLQTSWRTRDLELAIRLADILLEQFEDKDNGGFFFTSHDHETLIYRPKPMSDDALPGGNGIAALVLARLGHLLGETRYLDAAERTLRLAMEGIAKIPYAYNAMLLALEEYLDPPQNIVLRGVEPDLSVWHARAHQFYSPRRLSFSIPADIDDLPGLLAERKPGAAMVAYVCEGHHCDAPITDLTTFEETLQNTEVAP